MRLPLLIVVVLVAGLLAAGFYSARTPARTDVPGIELSVVRERAQPERPRPAPVKRRRESRGREDASGGSGGGGGSAGAAPIRAPAPHLLGTATIATMTTPTETTTLATTPATTEPSQLPGRRALVRLLAPLRRFQASFRVRVLAGYVGLLALATFGAIFVAREALAGRLDERIDSELVQESRELRQLALGNDPETGEPFAGQVRRIFEVYLSRNVPSRNEVLLTFIDGEPFLRSSGRPGRYRLDLDPELVARWGSLERTDRGGVDTPDGRVEYLGVPLVGAGETQGVFVAAIFRDLESGEVDDALRVVAGVGLAMLLVGSVLAWLLADRVLRPVTAITKTARTISAGGDLSRRIPVSGHDEIAVLAGTFNDMLVRLETAFETQRRFVDDAGHELRTPLTIVRGHLELLEDDPAERRATLELVLDELDRMARLVNDMLTLAKWERPDFLSPAPVDVGVLTDDLLAKAEAIGNRRWSLVARATATIVADRQRVTQALVQLAQNAVQHTQEGDEIGLGTFVGGGEARLWVRDTGPGIPFEEQERVFARFYRSGAERRSDGAGLGLSIVQAIARAHGGRLELASVPGSGATFTVVLPLEDAGVEGGVGR